MTIYPVEFHRRLEQKWATRIDQILTVTGAAPPPHPPTSKAPDRPDFSSRTRFRSPFRAKRTGNCARPRRLG